jgi:hypothetical protein
MTVEHIEGICCKPIKWETLSGKVIDVPCVRVIGHKEPCSMLENQKCENYHQIHGRKKWLASEKAKLTSFGDTQGWGDFFERAPEVGLKKILKSYESLPEDWETVPDTFLFAALLGDWTPRRGCEKLIKELEAELKTYPEIKS